MDRKDFFRKGLRQIASDLLKTPAGESIDRQLQGISNFLAPGKIESQLPSKESSGKKNTYCRTPGALPDPAAFRKACNHCGDCIMACPYGTIFRLNPRSGPVIDPNLSACHLCEDFPCITSCETGALLPLDGALPKFGQAEL